MGGGPADDGPAGAELSGVPAVAVGNADDADDEGATAGDVAALLEVAGVEAEVVGVGVGVGWVVFVAIAGNFLSSPRQCNVATTAPAAITTTNSETRSSRSRLRSLRR